MYMNEEARLKLQAFISESWNVQMNSKMNHDEIKMCRSHFSYFMEI